LVQNMVRVDGLEISEEWLVSKAAAIGNDAVVLLQGYEWTGLGYLNGEQRLDFGRPLDWRWPEYWDVRIFGEVGEWHCWRVDERKWSGRYVTAQEWEEKEDREYVLRGRELEGNWVRESGGAKFYYPKALVSNDLKEHPLRLSAWLEVGEDVKTGQAFFRDAMLRGIGQQG